MQLGESAMLRAVITTLDAPFAFRMIPENPLLPSPNS
jgi:hypothetical protein